MHVHVPDVDLGYGIEEEEGKKKQTGELGGGDHSASRGCGQCGTGGTGGMKNPQEEIDDR
jgi:hypothetical protein